MILSMRIAMAVTKRYRVLFQSRYYTSVVLSNVYPDVSTSAACVRTNSIVLGLQELGKQQQQRHDDGDEYHDDDHCYHGKKTSKPIIKMNNSSNSGNFKTNNNCVYYATSTDIKDIKNPFAGVVKKYNPDYNNMGVTEIIHLPPNRSDLMEKHFGGGLSSRRQSTTDNEDKNRDEDKTKRQEKAAVVDLVVFDRFYMEEAHSFRFRQSFPDAVLVLDMQDMHSLRWGRHAIVKAWDKENEHQKKKDPMGCLSSVMDYLPTAVADDRFTRELASIHRSDLTLVCSPVELSLLETVYRVPKDKLCLASFFVDEESCCSPPFPQQQSRHSSDNDDEATSPRFVFCGNFKHAPNADAVRLLMDFVWPQLRSELPTASLHIYGAFCPLKQQQKASRDGIHIHGFEPDLTKIFGQEGSILLAPLRFGAGIKGKIVDAWTFGMPVVTTPIGSEGMTTTINNNNNDESLLFGGRVAFTLDGFCESAIDLVKRPEDYCQAQANGRFLLEKLFSANRNQESLQRRLLKVLDKDSLARKRQSDYTQAMLWHQSQRSTEFFSRWVELKENVAQR